MNEQNQISVSLCEIEKILQQQTYKNIIIVTVSTRLDVKVGSSVSHCVQIGPNFSCLVPFVLPRHREILFFVFVFIPYFSEFPFSNLAYGLCFPIFFTMDLISRMFLMLSRLTSFQVLQNINTQINLRFLNITFLPFLFYSECNKKIVSYCR